MEERLPRKLAAILYADVVGYSRMASEDEDATHRRLKESLDLIATTVKSYHGRVINYSGDAALAMFDAVVDALSCAAAIQCDIAQSNQDVPDKQIIQFRIGVNLGDVIEDAGDIFGNGVNVAARLEGLAEPGGICITEQVYMSVGSKLPLEYKDLGEQKVKNIAKPVRAYRVILKSEAQVPRPSDQLKPRKAKRWSPITALLVLFLMVTGGGVYWLKPWESFQEPASVERMAYPLPDKPSIAVLPFDNMSNDPNQEYFVDGMTEDLITDLSKLSGLFVIARNSSFNYKGKSISIKQVGEELGVRYVLEGSVRRVGNQVRINAQLIDGADGGHLWAERYDGSIDDVFGLQDEISKQIVRALSVTLTPQEVENIERGGTTNTQAYDAYLLGLSYYHQGTPSDNREAIKHLSKAVELDTSYSAAYTALTKVYASAFLRDYVGATSLGMSWTSLVGEILILLEKNVESADADFHVVRSWLALRKRQHARAINEANRALALSPNSSDALEALSEALIYSGEIEEGLVNAKIAMRQNPAQIGRSLYLTGLGEYIRGDTQAAVKLLEEAIDRTPERIEYLGVLTAAYAEQGSLDKAKSAFLRFAPSVSNTLPGVARVLVGFPIDSRDVLERFARSLTTAGVVSKGFFPLYSENRLTDDEIRSLLFGANISGTEFWRHNRWEQSRNGDGKVEHSGAQIVTGVPYSTKQGFGRVVNDLLCERWPEFIESGEICVTIFKMPGKASTTTRRGDYVMVTATGPNPFRVSE